MIQTKQMKQGGGSPWQDIVIADFTDSAGSRHVYNIGGSGCYLTTLAAALWAFQIDTDPGRLASALKALPGWGDNGGFTAEGLVENDAITALYPQVLYIKGVSTVLLAPQGGTTFDAAAKEVQRLLGMGQPVIFQVDANPGDGKNNAPTHFIEAVDWNGGDPLVMDPIYGDVATLSKRYGPFAQAVFGYRVFIGPPVSAGCDLESGVAAWKIAMAKNRIAARDYAVAKQYASEALDNFIS